MIFLKFLVFPPSKPWPCPVYSQSSPFTLDFR